MRIGQRNLANEAGRNGLLDLGTVRENSVHIILEASISHMRFSNPGRILIALNSRYWAKVALASTCQNT